MLQQFLGDIATDAPVVQSHRDFIFLYKLLHGEKLHQGRTGTHNLSRNHLLIQLLVIRYSFILCHISFPFLNYNLIFVIFIQSSLHGKVTCMSLNRYISFRKFCTSAGNRSCRHASSISVIKSAPVISQVQIFWDSSSMEAGRIATPNPRSAKVRAVLASEHSQYMSQG